MVKPIQNGIILQNKKKLMFTTVKRDVEKKTRQPEKCRSKNQRGLD